MRNMKYDKESLTQAGLLNPKYIRDPEAVAWYLTKYHSSKRLLIFGTGQHTHEVKEHLSGHECLCGVVRESNMSAGYVRFSMGSLPIYDESDLKDVDFDFLVLLGLWSDSSFAAFSSQIGIDKDKILRPYLMNEVTEKALDNFSSRNSLKLSADKPNLALILTHDRRDFITGSASYLSKHFNLIKIYIKNSLVYKQPNRSFKQVIFVNEQPACLSLLINEKHAPETVVFWISSQYDMWLAYHVKKMMPECTKFITASSDFYFNGLYKYNPKTIGRFLGMNKFQNDLNSKAEKLLLRESDGVISNNCGPYARDILRNYNVNYFYTYNFTDPKHFYTIQKSAEGKKRKLCFVGTLAPLSYTKHNSIFSTSYFVKIFEQLLEQDFEIHTYSYFNIKEKGYQEYYALKERFPDTFVWHDFVPSKKLPSVIAQYDYGLAIVNVTDRVEKIVKNQLDSLFHARIVSFLAAGLPIIASSEYTVAKEYVQFHGIGPVVSNADFSRLAEILDDCDYNSYKSSVEEARQRYARLNLNKKLANFLLNTINHHKLPKLIKGGKNYKEIIGATKAEDKKNLLVITLNGRKTCPYLNDEYNVFFADAEGFTSGVKQLLRRAVYDVLIVDGENDEFIICSKVFSKSPVIVCKNRMKTGDKTIIEQVDGIITTAEKSEFENMQRLNPNTVHAKAAQNELMRMIKAAEYTF